MKLGLLYRRYFLQNAGLLFLHFKEKKEPIKSTRNYKCFFSSCSWLIDASEYDILKHKFREPGH